MSKSAAMVPTHLIDAHHTNVRHDLGDLRPLIASIERHGLMVPVIVERRGDRYRLRDGHRRWAAALTVSLARIPAIVHSDALDTDEWLAQAVEINEQRRQLTGDERRHGVLRLRKLGWTWQGIADAYGVSAPTVKRWIEPGPGPRVRRPPLNAARLARVLDDWRARDGDLDDLLAHLEELINP